MGMARIALAVSSASANTVSSRWANANANATLIKTNTCNAKLRSVAPHLDHAGAWLREKVAGSRILDKDYNRAHVAVWVAVAIFSIAGSKDRAFQNIDHWHRETPQIVEHDPMALPRCEENPVWCEPFSFLSEIRMWVGTEAKN